MFTATPQRLLIAFAMLVMTIAAWAAPMKWTLGGYVQPRYTEQFGFTGEDFASTLGTFKVFRPSLLIRATDDEHVFLQFFISTPAGSNSPEFQHAFAEYRMAPYFFDLGLKPIPFGYENPITSCKLITMERSEVSRVLIGKKALDKGVYAYYMPTEGNFNLSAALVNGEDYNVASDSNSKKNIVARLGYKIPVFGEVGGSLITGQNAGTPVGANYLRYGVDAVGKLFGATTVAEYIWGKDGAAKSKGGYLTAAYLLPGTAFEPYARYDAFDPASGADFKRGTFGLGYYVNPSSKISAEYQTIDDQGNPDVDGSIAFQYQIIF